MTVTQETYVIDEAAIGPWTVNLHGDITEDTEYLFGVIGAGPGAEPGQRPGRGHRRHDRGRKLDAGGRCDAHGQYLRDDGADRTGRDQSQRPVQHETFPVFGGERLLTGVNTTIDGTVNSAALDLSGLESGTYYIHVEADDFSDPPQHAYAKNGDGTLATVTVNHTLPATWDNPNIVVTPEYMGLHVDFTPMINPDVDKYIVRFRAPATTELPEYLREVETTHTFANTEDWLEPGKTYYVSVAAYDGDTGHEECVEAGCDLTNPDTPRTFVGATVIWSAEVTGVPLGASFELVTTDPPEAVTGGGTAATAYFTVINTGEASADRCTERRPVRAERARWHQRHAGRPVRRGDAYGHR